GEPKYADLGAIERRGVVPSGPSHPPVHTVAVQTASPNPTDGRAELVVSLPVAGSVQVRVLDITGRRIWSASRDLPAGNSVIRWFGTRDDGERVKAGVY